MHMHIHLPIAIELNQLIPNKSVKGPIYAS